MDEKDFKSLALVRLERAKELYKEETRELLKFTAEFLEKTEKYVKESYN